MSRTLKHPTENRSISNGIYEATIAGIVHGEYAGESHYLRIILWCASPPTFAPCRSGRNLFHCLRLCYPPGGHT